MHVRTRADARNVNKGPIQVVCQATGSLVKPSKSQGLEICAPDGGPPFFGACPLTEVLFVAVNTPSTHLGVLVGRDPAAQAAAAYGALIERMHSRAQRKRTKERARREAHPLPRGMRKPSRDVPLTQARP